MQRYAEFPGHCPTIGLKSDGAGAPSHTSLVTLPPTLSRWIWKTIDTRELNGSHGYIYIYLLNPLYPIFPPEKHSAGVARGHRGAGGEHAEWVGHSRIWRVWMRLRDQLPSWESDGDLWRLLTCVEVITPRRVPSHWVMRFGRRRCLVIGISFPFYFVLLIKIQFARLVCGYTSFLTELIDPIMKNPAEPTLRLHWLGQFLQLESYCGRWGHYLVDFKRPSNVECCNIQWICHDFSSGSLVSIAEFFGWDHCCHPLASP